MADPIAALENDSHSDIDDHDMSVFDDNELPVGSFI